MKNTWNNAKHALNVCINVKKRKNVKKKEKGDEMSNFMDPKRYVFS